MKEWFTDGLEELELGETEGMQETKEGVMPHAMATVGAADPKVNYNNDQVSKGSNQYSACLHEHKDRTYKLQFSDTYSNNLPFFIIIKKLMLINVMLINVN